MAVTIKELSARCGLSVSTVSKALNDYPDVSEETRKQVRAVADEMGYRANAIARSLKIGRTFNLGVLYSDDTESGFTHSYFSPMLQSFKQEAERRGYDITFITHNMGHSKMTYLEHCRYRNVDGVCIVCSHFDDSEVLQLVSSPLPLVTIDHVFNNKACVQSENRQGIEALTRYILSMGHKKVAFIYGAQDTVSDIRLTSFLRTMNDAGLSVLDDYLIASPYHDPASTREATAQLLSLRDRPTCILMPDDYSALGGMDAIRATGLRVPEDISITGYDGVAMIQMCQPQLTTVEQDAFKIGREAARKLVHLIEQPRTTLPEIVSVPCRLITGGTVARLA